jgi:hypothetical protein
MPKRPPKVLGTFFLLILMPNLCLTFRGVQQDSYRGLVTGTVDYLENEPGQLVQTFSSRQKGLSFGRLLTVSPFLSAS